MERQLGGAVVKFSGSDLGPRVFGTIPASGAFRVKDGKLQVKISKEGTTHGNWHDSDMLASDTSAIWLGAISGLSSSKPYTLGSLPADIQVVPVTEGGVKELRITVAGTPQLFGGKPPSALERPGLRNY